MLTKNQIKLIRSLRIKKNRNKHGLFVAEGEKIVDELLDSNLKLYHLFTTEDKYELSENYTVLKSHELEKISILKTPNKVLAVFEIPELMEIDFNKNIIDKIVNDKKVPVIAPLGLDENNQTYNINADTAAGSIAKKIEARRLIIMSDVEGVLDNNQKLIPEINSTSIKELIENETITGGMIPKINNCLDVASNGVKGVVIIDGRKNHSILFELLSDKGSGTLIRQ